LVGGLNNSWYTRSRQGILLGDDNPLNQNINDQTPKFNLEPKTTFYQRKSAIEINVVDEDFD